MDHFSGAADSFVAAAVAEVDRAQIPVAVAALPLVEKMLVAETLPLSLDSYYSCCWEASSSSSLVDAASFVACACAAFAWSSS